MLSWESQRCWVSTSSYLVSGRARSECCFQQASITVTRNFHRGETFSASSACRKSSKPPAENPYSIDVDGISNAAYEDVRDEQTGL